MAEFIKVLVFDTIIGNQDRHQDNWGFIVPPVRAEEIEQGRFFQRKRRVFVFSDPWKEAFFSPIYDSGSCLGRELEDAKLEKLLADNNMMASYIKRGKAELRWENKKVGYYELLEKMLGTAAYSDMVKKTIRQIAGNYNHQTLKGIVDDIDACLPENLSGIPLVRKNFVVKLIDERIKLLKEIYRNYDK